MVRISKTIVAGICGACDGCGCRPADDPGVGRRLAAGGGWHGGGGGWHGGGWHGGGWGGGGWHGGGWRGGWAGGRVWHGGYWRGGYWYNGWWGPAIAAGVSGGAAIASYPYWGGGYGYGMAAAAAGSFGRPTTLTAISSASSPSTSADVRASSAFNGASRKRGPFHLRAGQNTPPVIGFGTPVVVGKEIGRPRRERKRQIGETLRFDAVAVEADRLDRLDLDLQPFAEPAHEVRVSPPAAADQPARRRLRDVLQRRRGRFDRERARASPRRPRRSGA